MVVDSANKDRKPEMKGEEIKLHMIAQFFKALLFPVIWFNAQKDRIDLMRATAD